MLNNKAESRLLQLVDDPEAGRNSYWEKKLSSLSLDRIDQGRFSGGFLPEGHTPRGSLRNRLTHHVLLTPWRKMGAEFPSFDSYLGIARSAVERRGGRLDLCMMRQVLTLCLLTERLPLHRMLEPIVLIGDGWGSMASLVLACFPQPKVVLINLTKPLLVDIVYTKKAHPGVNICLTETLDEYMSALSNSSVGAIAVRADDAEIVGNGPIGLAINIVSMQEMEAPVVASYFDILRQAPGGQTFFYCCNRISKAMPDETVSRFHEYPWSLDDEILVDELCPWHQFHYNIRRKGWNRFRPQLYRPGPGPIWHRLVALNKRVSRRDSAGDDLQPRLAADTQVGYVPPHS